MPKRSITLYGPIPRHSKDRIVTIQFHPSGKFLGCQASDRTVELYRIRTHDEIRKKMARRQKRQKEKAEKRAKAVLAGGANGGVAMDAPADAPADADAEIRAGDEITQYQIIRTKTKVRSFDFAPVADVEKAGSVQILMSLNSNVLEVYNAALPSKKKSDEMPEPTKMYSVDLQGHRSDVRTLALSSDDELLCSASNTRNLTMRAFTLHITEYLDPQVILGTKAGELELYDIASSSLLEMIKAHEGPVWSLQVRPDKRGLVTGSADKDIKFWDFDMVEEEANRPKRLTLVHMRTLKMSDDVLCVRYSPDQNLIAVSLLDATVKVFYHDTLKFFLSLYGHKVNIWLITISSFRFRGLIPLPVLSMDISSDSTLLATSSADKNVKLWGLDFGDCHKSIFAHQESVMAVQFVWGTHYFFTVGKDRVVKYWDGDKFENIMKLDGHHGEVWALAIAKHGSFVVSGSHDRSIRVWERTEEQLFLEEEREKELEELYETTLSNQLEKTDLQDGEGTEVASAGKQTMETLKAGERIMEALDTGDEDKGAWEDYELLKSRGLNPAPPQRSPILAALGDVPADKYVLNTVEKIRANDLEEALLVLPFSKVISLIGYVDAWAKKTHHHQIVSNRMMRPMLDSIRFHLREQLKRHKDTMGYNLAALRYMRRDWENRNLAEFWDEDTQKEKEKDSAKRKFVTVTV
ncbi:WD40-repeat-containing domain protein [Jimgerdemannia flammicorona]|uniref:WD40-repeat-containing domain protein n=1 Tax=Jimgerdemannia flammicorona TaxID=994334 RepID=A0A433DGQ7_9FUNG|nr:WD40-repeat-containing domain protein [Jimgerdemannia flammicorona]